MDTRTMLRKSTLIAPAEDALRNAQTTDELEDAWFDWADGFADDSAERRHLLEIFMDRLAQLKAERWAKILRT